MNKNILWIDDKPSMSLIDLADTRQLNIIPKECVDDGIAELLNPSVSYDAIILDANCIKHKFGSEEEKKANTDVSALPYALKEIYKNHIRLPWFVYTGGGFVGEDAIKHIVQGYERPYDDKDSYNKPAEMKLMLDKIDEVIANSSLFKMKSKYPEVCEAFPWTDLIDLMIDSEDTLSFQRSVKTPNQIRTLLEKTSDFMLQAGLVFFDVQDAGLNKYSQFVGGCSELFPPYVQRSFHSLTVYSNAGSHYLDVRKDIEAGFCPYLNFQSFYELLTILKWCANLEMSTDAINERLEKSKKWAKEKNFRVFIFEGEVKKDGMGTIHCGDYVLNPKQIPSAEELIGKTIGIVSSDFNKDAYTVSLYKNIVKKFSKL